MSSEALGMNDKLFFGKHKGKTVSEVMKSDPGWLAWLRDQRKKDGKPSGMSRALHDAINKKITGDGHLKKKFSEWNLEAMDANGFFNAAVERMNAMDAAHEAIAHESVTRDRLLAHGVEWGSW